MREKKLNNPKISVIIPVYNGEIFLEDTIKSVLNQNYDNWECIVVDDGSIDGSAAIAKKHEQIIYLHREHKNVAAARNLGIQKASGEYLAFLDADDIWDTNKLETQINYMEENPDIDYSITKHSLFLTEGLKDIPQWVRTNHLQEETLAYIPSSLIVRKSAFEIVGYFDESYQISDDSDWFLRARDAGIKLGIIDKNLLHKRVHSQCLMSQTGVIKKELMKSIRASLWRVKLSGDISDGEFVAMLKSAVKENRLNSISGKDLLKICERAKSVNASGNMTDTGLLEDINTKLEEIKRRRLPL
ncbi:MAG: glycosyltransferase [Smithella sp.]|jgi:glycosyltransferase involved in cell wall biosynthesis